jgi:hypothetical protein
MRRTTRIAASTLAIAALGIAGSQSGANANQFTNTCSHGVVVPSSGHPAGVVYVSSANIGAVHRHKYLHHDIIFGDHYATLVC